MKGFFISMKTGFLTVVIEGVLRSHFESNFKKQTIAAKLNY
jgi:hypothetical protein